MNKFYGPHDEETEVVVSYLRNVFQIPEYVTEFSIHFDIEDVIKINCTYYPEKSQ